VARAEVRVEPGNPEWTAAVIGTKRPKTKAGEDVVAMKTIRDEAATPQEEGDR